MQRAVFPRPSRFAVPTATVSPPQVNYKVRPDGRPAIFEINVRLGADVACEVEPARLRLLLERLGAAGGGPGSPISPRLSEALHAMGDVRPKRGGRGRGRGRGRPKLPK